MFVETYVANSNASKASDVELWPASSGEADDSQKRRDEVLASTLAKTEIMVLILYQQGHLSLPSFAKDGSGAHEHVETTTIQSRRFAERHHHSATSAT